MKLGHFKFWLLTVVLQAVFAVPTVLGGDSAGVRADLLARAQSVGEVRLIVQLDVTFQPLGRLRSAEALQQERTIAERQAGLAAKASIPGLIEVARFRHIPFMVFLADAQGIGQLASMKEVIGLQEDIPEPPNLADSTLIIGADLAWAGGYDGQGQAVAVLDTGVELQHSFFSAVGKIAAEACYSTTLSDTITSLCPAGVTASTTAGSGNACPEEVYGCGHGTHVGGIAAGNDGAGPLFGVGRGATLIPIQVFTRFDSTSNCGNPANTPCALSYPSDQIRALEQVFDLSASITIAAVNMSLGGGSFPDQASCDEENPARKAAIDNLRSVGIATVVSSGNTGLKNATGQPGCISSVISVSASTKQDAVASFSNVADFLDLLAPGAGIVSSVPGGALSETAAMNGTSMAAPHVSGAWAVLRQAVPAASIDTILAALRDTGTAIDDLRANGTVTDMRRINLDLALAQLVPDDAEFDSEPAAGSLLEFGLIEVGENSPEHGVQVGNSGGLPLALMCSIDGADASDYLLTQCPEAVAAGESEMIWVRCLPASEGSKTGVLELLTDDADESHVSFDLACTGMMDVIFSDRIGEPAIDPVA